MSDNLVPLFIQELERAIPTITHHLIRIEGNMSSQRDLEALMRAAHSIKGSAKVLSLESIISLAHVMEECFEKAKGGTVALSPSFIDLLLKAVDSLDALAKTEPKQIDIWLKNNERALEELIDQLKTGTWSDHSSPLAKPSLSDGATRADLTLRVTAHHLNRLMGLAGEAVVDSNWLQPYTHSLTKLKEGHWALASLLERLQEATREKRSQETLDEMWASLIRRSNSYRESLDKKISELELFWRRNSALADRFYQEVLEVRMRPFQDLLEGLPRLVRDMGKELSKNVQLKVDGAATQVDREVIESFESPLAHLIRNAIDHGIEMPDERDAHGKPKEGTILVEAHQMGDTLEISVSDDGRGVDLEELRNRIGKPNYSEEELLNHLFTPGFTTKEEATKLSGRGFGLDIVKEAASRVGGTVHIFQRFGKGMSVTIILPLTRSLVRALIVEIAEEPYAFPLNKVDRALELAIDETCPHPLIPAAKILGLEGARPSSRHVVQLSLNHKSVALLVDRFLGQKELVLQEIDHRLGKIPYTLAGALLEDGSPLLILDVDELLRSSLWSEP